MAIAAIVIVSILLIILFFGVTIAGGRAHDRANAEAARRRDKTPQQRGSSEAVRRSE